MSRLRPRELARMKRLFLEHGSDGVVAEVMGLQKFATDPTTELVEGRMIYNSTEKRIKYYDGSKWIANNPDVLDWIRDHDVAFVFVGGPYAGSAGGAAVTVSLELQDGLGVKNLFSTPDRKVTVASSGSGVISTPEPIVFSGGVATIDMTNAVVEGITLSLSDTESTGLDVSDTIAVTFS